MIKKISLFILGLVSLGLINFSNAGSLTEVYTGTFTSVIGSSNFSASNTNFLNTRDYGYVGYIDSVGLNSTNVSISYSCTLSNFNSSDFLDSLKSSTNKLKAIVNRGYVSTSSYNRYFSITTYNQTSSNNWSSFDSSSNSITFNGTLSNSFYYLGSLYFQYSNSSVSSTCSYNSSPSLDKSCIFDFDYSCTITYQGDYIINNSNSDCSTVESQLSTCQSSLSTCQSDLNTCQNSSISCDYSSYESQIESLSGQVELLSGSLALCESENLTLSGNLSTCEGELNSCMSGIGTGDLQWSALFINNIQHLGASTIRITIPEEISWDYTNENDEFNLDVEGYNVDTEYIEGIINTQSTLPNQVDLNNLVKVVLPLFVPGLVIILFIYFVFRFIKKIF